MILLPASLLRSVIRIGDENEELLASNLYMLRQEVEPPGVDGLVINFIGDLFDRTKAIPSSLLIFDHFKSENGNSAVATRLSEIVGETVSNELIIPTPKFIFGPDFRYALDQYKAKMMRETLGNLLIESSSILSGGIRKGGQVIEGPEATIIHLTSTLSTLNGSLKRGSIEGSFRKDSNLVRKRYEHWKSNPGDTVGVLTGIDKLDAAHRGARNGELCLVLGFVSHLKTTFCFNWLYKAAVLFGRNVGIASLEMTIPELRDVVYVMHTNHPKFAEQNMPAVDFEKFKAGSLDSDEEATLEAAIADMDSCDEYGEIFYKEPQEALTIHEIQRWAESKHKTHPIDLLVIDYLGLVDPGKGVSSLDSGANLNKAIRQAKMMAMTFGNGRGIPVVSPFQANREGLKEAEKNGGRYKLTALANANESERSTDKVYYVYLDDTLRNSRELIVGNLKNRNGPVIMDQFKVFADPSTRTIDNLEVGGSGAASIVDL